MMPAPPPLYYGKVCARCGVRAAVPVCSCAYPDCTMMCAILTRRIEAARLVKLPNDERRAREHLAAWRRAHPGGDELVEVPARILVVPEAA